jgi:hypothetical protein
MTKLEIGDKHPLNKSMSPDYEGRTKITDYIDCYGRICASCVVSHRGSPSGFLFLLWLITLPCVLQICKMFQKVYWFGVGFWIIYGLLLYLGHRMQKASIEKQARKEGLRVYVCYYHSN